MTTETSAAGKMAWLVLMVFTLLFGLCTVFAVVTTGAQAWQEHVEAGWPEVTARVEKCAMLQNSAGPRKFNIRCHFSYAVGTEQNTATVYSGYTNPSTNGILAEWVDEHPQGTPIILRYDPADHAKVVQVAPVMPGGGPHTPNNIKLLEFFAVGFLVMALLARVTRPRTPWRTAYAAMPSSIEKVS